MERALIAHPEWIDTRFWPAGAVVLVGTEAVAHEISEVGNPDPDAVGFAPPPEHQISVLPNIIVWEGARGGSTEYPSWEGQYRRPTSEELLWLVEGRLSERWAGWWAPRTGGDQ